MELTTFAELRQLIATAKTEGEHRFRFFVNDITGQSTRSEVFDLEQSIERAAGTKDWKALEGILPTEVFEAAFEHFQTYDACQSPDEWDSVVLHISAHTCRTFNGAHIVSIDLEHVAEDEETLAA